MPKNLSDIVLSWILSQGTMLWTGEKNERQEETMWLLFLLIFSKQNIASRLARFRKQFLALSLNKLGLWKVLKFKFFSRKLLFTEKNLSYIYIVRMLSFELEAGKKLAWPWQQKSNCWCDICLPFSLIFILCLELSGSKNVSCIDAWPNTSWSLAWL